MRAWCGHPGGAAGFWLSEAVIAAGLLVTLAAGLAQLAVLSNHASRSALESTVMLLAAVQKLEQLKGLTWTFNRRGAAAFSDMRTDVAVDPPQPIGRGLAPSPSGSLESDTPGYVDYLDPRGTSLPSTGSRRPSGTAYIRRWAVRALGARDRDLLVCDVVVISLAYADRARGNEPDPSDPGVVWLTTLKSRR